MTDAEVRHVILFMADKAWEIASHGGAPPEVCRAIEAMSDDPSLNARLLAEIKRGFATGWKNEP